MGSSPLCFLPTLSTYFLLGKGMGSEVADESPTLNLRFFPFQGLSVYFVWTAGKKQRGWDACEEKYGLRVRRDWTTMLTPGYFPLRGELPFVFRPLCFASVLTPKGKGKARIPSRRRQLRCPSYPSHLW